MPAETKIVRIDRPFTGGLADYPDDPRQAALLQDAIYRDEVCCERGAWAYVLETDPLGGSKALTSVCEQVATAGGQSTADVVVSGLGALGLNTSASRKGAAPISSFEYYAGGSVEYRVLPGLFNGEFLLFPQDGVSPILRYNATLESRRTEANSVAVNDGLSNITFTALTLTAADVGCFITIRGVHGSWRIDRYRTSTKASIFGSWPATFTANQGTVRATVDAVGVLGLLTKVTGQGTVSKTGTGLTVTGSDTAWATASPDQGAPLPYDFIAPIDGNDYGNACSILTVDSDTQVTLVGNTAYPAFSAGAVGYVIGRPLVGKWGFVHKDRLYTGGVDWAPRRMQVSPPLWDGQSPENGEFSYDVDIGRASLSSFQDVPHPKAPGTLKGGMSLPSGNGMVCSDRDIHVFWGEYPSMSFDKVADFGVFDERSILTADDGAWVAGPTGVYEIRGNTPDLISGPIDNAYRSVADGVGAVVLSFHDGHLFVSMDSGADATTFVWDTRSRTWPGKWTTPRATGACSSRIPGASPRLLAALNGTRLAELGRCVVGHEDDFTTNNDGFGSFRARTHEEVLGDLSREREVKYVKVQYQLLGASAARLDVSAGPDVPAAPTAPALSLAPTSGEAIGVGYATPSTASTPAFTGLGERTNRWDLDLFNNAGSADDVTRLVVHEIEMLVKEYRHRGG